ncbi:MAG: HAD family hydrolase [Rubrivivax sp.]|nr:HAD family hydrolase [Rubrivivax sp.]
MRDTLAILEEGQRATLFDVYARQLGRTDDAGQAWRWRLIEAFRAARPPSARLYDDVAGCLAQLRHRGLRLALLTDNPAASQQHKIDCAGLAPAFDALVLTAEIGGSGAPKPQAAAFHAAATQLDLPPAALVMVGDHVFRDSLGALEAGYAHAFHIQRAGAFFNFDLALCVPLLPPGRMTVLQSLTELDAHLPAGSNQ